MPRRGTRAAFIAALQGYATRVFQRLILELLNREYEQRLRDLTADYEQQMKVFRAELRDLKLVLPPDVVLSVRESSPADERVMYVSLNFDAISTQELAQAVDRIAPAPRGRPKGRGSSLANLALIEKLHAAVEAGEGSIRSVSERIAKRSGVPAETLQKQYRRYRKRAVQSVSLIYSRNE
jgi:hypothetical protein